MKSILFLLIATILICFTTQSEWQEYPFADAGFSISLPDKPKGVLPLNLYPNILDKALAYSLTKNNELFQIVYVRIDNISKNGEIQESMLKGARNRLIVALKEKNDDSLIVQSEQKVKVQEITSGLRFLVVGQKKTYEVGIYVLEKDICFLIASNTNNGERPTHGKTFIESIKIIP